MKTARVEVYRDKAGEYRWRLRAINGEVVAQGEGHPRIAHAWRAWWEVAAIARGPVEEVPTLQEG